MTAMGALVSGASPTHLAEKAGCYIYKHAGGWGRPLMWLAVRSTVTVTVTPVFEAGPLWWVPLGGVLVPPEAAQWVWQGRVILGKDTWLGQLGWVG